MCKIKAISIGLAVALFAALSPAGPASAESPTTDLQVDALRINGVASGATQTIPAGASISEVSLSVSDPLSSRLDAFSLVAPSTFPAVLPGEPATLSVDGAAILSAAPAFENVLLQTNIGTIFGVSFTDGANTYFVPRRDAAIEGASTVTADSVIRNNGISTIQYVNLGFRPAGALTFTGQIFSQRGSFNSPGFTATVQLFDADTTRGSADSPSEEMVILTVDNDPIALDFAVELDAVLEFTDGSRTAGVRAVRTGQLGGLGGQFFYIFDSAALAASGHTIDDVSRVATSSPTNHGLNWLDLGFTTGDEPAQPPVVPSPVEPPVVPSPVEPPPSVNQAPTAVDDAYRTSYRTSLSVSASNGVLANDFDQDGDPLVATLASRPENGRVQINSDGSFVYVPNRKFSGTDTFTYSVTDGESSSTAEVEIDVAARRTRRR